MKPISALANEIQPQIEAFMKQQAAVATTSKESTPEKGAEDLSSAIAYGIAKAWSSGAIQGAMSAWIVPPAGGPVGSAFFSSVKGISTEV